MFSRWIKTEFTFLCKGFEFFFKLNIRDEAEFELIIVTRTETRLFSSDKYFEGTFNWFYSQFPLATNRYFPISTTLNVVLSIIKSYNATAEQFEMSDFWKADFITTINDVGGRYLKEFTTIGEESEIEEDQILFKNELIPDCFIKKISVYNVESDGNCLFHSLLKACEIEGLILKMDHRQLRAEVGTKFLKP